MDHGIRWQRKHFNPRFVSPFSHRTLFFPHHEFSFLCIPGFTDATTSPPKSTFDLHSFSYACVAGVPQPECAISIWAWKPSGRVFKRTITFPRLDPGHVIEDFKMNSTTFGREFKGLKSLGFSIARAGNGGDVYGGLALDDVKYTITTGC